MNASGGVRNWAWNSWKMTMTTPTGCHVQRMALKMLRSADPAVCAVSVTVCPVQPSMPMSMISTYLPQPLPLPDGKTSIRSMRPELRPANPGRILSGGTEIGAKEAFRSAVTP